MSAYRGFAVGALLLAGAFAVFSACGQDSDEAATPDAREDEIVLRELPFAEIVGNVFQVNGLQDNGGVAEGPDGSVYRSLRRLTGRLLSPQAMAMAVFVEFLPPEGATTLAGPPTGAGVYVALVELDERRQPHYGPLTILTSSRREIVPVEQAQSQGTVPFQQGTLELDASVSVGPALVIDLEGDGVEEMVLARRSRRGQLSWYEHDVYRREPPAPGWTIADRSEVQAPGLTALAYWSDVMSAIRLAVGWEPDIRLLVVWSWLSDEEGAVTPELLLELVPDGDSERIQAQQETLTHLRTFFQEAHSQFSDGFRVRQPWPAFVNSFKNTEAVELLGVSPPSIEPDGEATVDVLLDLTEREGDTPTKRRFLVTTTLVQEGNQWYLDDVQATEQREAE